MSRFDTVKNDFGRQGSGGDTVDATECNSLQRAKETLAWIYTVSSMQ